MNNLLPKLVPDVNNFTHDWNKLIQWGQSITPQSSSDIIVTQTSKGVSFAVAERIKKKNDSTTSSTYNQLQMFNITTCSNADYVIGIPISQSVLSNLSGSVRIAKSPRLRPSVTSEVIDGVTVTYSSYTADNTRTANDGTNSEFQVAFPRYVANTGSFNTSSLAVIFAAPCDYTGVASSSWLEVSPARVWARRYVQ